MTKEKEKIKNFFLKEETVTPDKPVEGNKGEPRTMPTTPVQPAAPVEKKLSTISEGMKIKGDIKAEELFVNRGNCASQNIEVINDVIIAVESVVSGNIMCTNVEINATVNGNIVASNKCGIQTESVINGNVKAKALSVEMGAAISGTFEVSK